MNLVYQYFSIFIAQFPFDVKREYIIIEGKLVDWIFSAKITSYILRLCMFLNSISLECCKIRYKLLYQYLFFF